MSHYIATDEDQVAIFGIGESADEAIADARREANEPDAEFQTSLASSDLVAAVERDGGNPQMGGPNWRIYGGIARRLED